MTAFDLDDSMVELARRRLHGRPVSLPVGHVCAIEQASGAIDTVVDFGIIHHVPGWQESIGEIARVLQAGRPAAVRGDPPPHAGHVAIPHVRRPPA